MVSKLWCQSQVPESATDIIAALDAKLISRALPLEQNELKVIFANANAIVLSNRSPD